MDDTNEALELERAADWRIKKLGADPTDRHSAAAAKLLQTLADDVRRLPGSPAYVEYIAILNWLGEFDVMEEFAARANEYRARIGVDRFPENGDVYLCDLIVLAKDVAGM